MSKRQDVKKQVRESLGLPSQPESIPTLPQEGHGAEFPLWSYSKKRSTVTELHINYDDGSFMTLKAPLGMPSPSFCGYLDVFLFYGQHDLFQRNFVEISIYSIFRTLDMDPNNGRAYAHFHRDIERVFAAFIKTDRFRNPETGERTYIRFFRLLQNMDLARRRNGMSRFYFDEHFLQSLRSGYLKRLDWQFCLFLDKRGQALARFLYGHVSKRIGNKPIYQRHVLGFLNDIGLGYIAKLVPYKRREKVKNTLFPALDAIRGEAFQRWQSDPETGNLIFFK